MSVRARRRWRGAWLAAVTVAAMMVAGCGPGDSGAATVSGTPGASSADGGSADGGSAAVTGSPPDAEQPAPSPTRVVPPPTAPAAPKRRPATKPATKATAKPTGSATTAPAEERHWDQRPECATYEGAAVSKKKAKAALTAAASRVYWRTEAPRLRVPARLIKAVSWQESGWQSNIVNCDGGFGLMQAMPDTVEHINQRFGLEYDARNYRDNAYVGANYLAWLTKKFGDNYFGGRYDLSPRRCDSHTDMCLLNMVISAYNAGDGGVEQAYDSGELPNPAYVDSVRSLMKACHCDRY